MVRVMAAHTSDFEGQVRNPRRRITIRCRNELQKSPLILVLKFFENRPKVPGEMRKCAESDEVSKMRESLKSGAEQNLM